jgi:hypothetical protein
MNYHGSIPPPQTNWVATGESAAPSNAQPLDSGPSVIRIPTSAGYGNTATPASASLPDR